jgi:hypothetical protein
MMGRRRRVFPLRTGFKPDEIKLMRSVLDEAAIILPKVDRTSAMKAKLATRILAAAAKGERDQNCSTSGGSGCSKDLTH